MSRPCPRRRRLLVTLASAAVLPVATACGGSPPREPTTAVPGDPELPDAPAVPVALSDVPEGRRIHVQWGQVPVELQRSGNSVQARALLCTHQGCRIAWDEDRACYRCACHDGRFDAAGMPIAGIPNRPLFRVPLLVSATTVYVGARA